MSSKRSPKSYLKSAKINKALIPSLGKYSRRKTLTRWEKSAITRAENKLKKLGTARIVPLSKRQVKALSNKDILIGNGVRGVHLDQTTKDAKATIKKGQLHVKSEGREYDYVTVFPDLGDLIAKGEQLFAKGAKEIWTWTRHGRSKRGWASFKAFVSDVTGLPNAWDTYKGLFSEDWFFGLVALYE